MRLFHTVSALALGGALVLSQQPAAAAPRYAYKVVPLAGQGSYATAINAFGQMAGRLTPSSGGEHGFRYSRGVLADIGTLPGDLDSIAWGINNRGQVVGRSFGLGRPSRAFLYSDGAMRDIGGLPGGSDSFAYDINDRGDIVGDSTLQQHFGFAFLYRNGIMRNLGAFPGTDRSTAKAINNRGQVTGSSGVGPAQGPNGNQTHAFLWEHGVMRDIGTLGGLNSMGEDINELGEVTGSSTRAGGDGDEKQWRGFVWSFGRMRDIGAPPGGTLIMPQAINNLGTVVGFYQAPNGQRAFLHRRGGATVDLNTLVDPAQGWVVTLAYDINDFGQVAGEACNVAFTICGAVRLDPLPGGWLGLGARAPAP